MSQVAVLAFFFLDHGVHVAHGIVFLLEIGMAIQALLLGKLAGGSHGRGNAGKKNGQNRQADHQSGRNEKPIDANRSIANLHQAFKR